MSSLKRQNHQLSNPKKQIEVLESGELPNFKEKIKNLGFDPLKPSSIDTLQVNVGKMCNQTCKHCHVDAGPDRKEIMTRETMRECLRALDNSVISTVDITGGAPEMNPHFRWFVEEISKRGKQIIVRCNLTIILANPKYRDLPDFFKRHKVEVVSSLPYFTSMRTDAQRGEGVFGKSIEALKMLNEVGYGQEGTGLVLNLVYNPAGAFLPGDQSGLEKEFKTKLAQRFDITFNNLFTITNLPVSRFLEYLVKTENYEGYMDELVNAFNPMAAANVMCRNILSVSWDGKLFDCDFNQMLELQVDERSPQHISDFDYNKLSERTIVLNQHCYGCTAGAGSSCGGTTA